MHSTGITMKFWILNLLVHNVVTRLLRKDVHSLHSLWEEHVLQLSENKGFRKKLNGEWRSLHKEKIHDLQSLTIRQTDRQTDRHVFVLQLAALVPC